MNKTVLGEVRRKIASKSAMNPPTPAVTVVTEVEPNLTDPEMKKAELINLVVERSGMKKKDVKPVVETMLLVLGETLAKGQEMNLQPFGRLKVNNTKDLAKAQVHSVRIRQAKNAMEIAGDGMAEAAE
jgi:nucleoid DNA-binding protein